MVEEDPKEVGRNNVEEEEEVEVQVQVQVHVVEVEVEVEVEVNQETHKVTQKTKKKMRDQS